MEFFRAMHSPSDSLNDRLKKREGVKMNAKVIK